MSHGFMLYVPELDPQSFVFFYHEGETDQSYSVRNYSRPGPALANYAAKYPYTASEILALARRPGCYLVPTKSHRTDDWAYWHQLTLELNQRYLAGERSTGGDDSARAPDAGAALTLCPREVPPDGLRAGGALRVRPRTPSRMNPAVGSSGSAAKGSRLCLQQYVEHAPRELADLLICHSPSLSAFDPQHFEWKSPLPGAKYYEYRDDFLVALELQRFEPLLEDFWPAGGPQWDGLAVVRSSRERGALLVEAKGHPGETLSSCAAGSEASRRQIQATLERVREWMGAGPADWLTGSYQLANRLAFLYFLNEVAGVPAWLALVQFVNDTSHKPTPLSEWRLHQQNLFRSLGLTADCRLLDRVITLYCEPFQQRE